MDRTNKQLVVDGFREFAAGNVEVLVDGQIVEHWDVVQPVPEADQIPNGMF
jgi:predicted SnoaL-like aldol condensation-catalyzing enzyme